MSNSMPSGYDHTFPRQNPQKSVIGEQDVRCQQDPQDERDHAILEPLEFFSQTGSFDDLWADMAESTADCEWNRFLGT